MALRILLVGIEQSVSALIRAAMQSRGHVVLERSVEESDEQTIADLNLDLVICEIDADTQSKPGMQALLKLQLPAIVISRDAASFRNHPRQPWAYLTKPLRIRQLVELAEEAGGARR